MKTIYTLKCISGFRDGNAFPRFIGPGEVLTVDEALFRRLTQSDPSGFEVLNVEKRVPPPTKAEPKQTKKGKASVKAASKKEADDGDEG